jgi:23S rRNA (uracil1939-C5)-methyltransferase
VRRNEPVQHVIGEPEIIESWSTMLPSLSQVPEVPLRRHPPAFFQGNRFLLAALVERVLMELTPGPVVDLYAGVGVFALGAAACGADEVTAVEDDPISGADLAANAQSAGGRVRVVRRTVERYLRGKRRSSSGVWIIDPPRTGLSREARALIANAGPHRLVYVSCDVATLARDLSVLGGAGYSLRRLDGFDFFPNTAHIELVAVLER